MLKLIFEPIKIFYKWLITIKKTFIFFLYIYIYIKMVNKCYQKNKEKPRKEARERYQNLSEEEKKGEKSLVTDIIKIFLKKKNKRKLSI